MTVFDLFPKLPTELRLLIWRMCLPCRVMELDLNHADMYWDEPPCDLHWLITRINACPPIISCVCRESRAVARKSAGPEDTWEHQFGANMIDPSWLDTARDEVHLHWNPSSDIDWQHYELGDPIRAVMWYAARTRSRRPSIMLDLLKSFQFRRRNEDWHLDRWNRSELADLMRTLPSWTVVVLDPTVIHVDAEAAAGLFGPLADARVQLVDADDQAGIDQFMALGEAPDATIGPRFGQEDLDGGKKALQSAVKVVFGDSAPVMRPAVMFRLCTNSCTLLAGSGSPYGYRDEFNLP